MCFFILRLLGFIEKWNLLLDQVQYIVLDEADRMLDEGFGPDIEKLMSSTGMPDQSKRNTFMFSATYSPAVIDLCKKYQKEVIFAVSVYTEE